VIERCIRSEGKVLAIIKYILIGVVTESITLFTTPGVQSEPLCMGLKPLPDLVVGIVPVFLRLSEKRNGFFIELDEWVIKGCIDDVSGGCLGFDDFQDAGILCWCRVLEIIRNHTDVEIGGCFEKMLEVVVEFFFGESEIEIVF